MVGNYGSAHKFHSLNFPMRTEGFYQDKLNNLAESFKNLKFNDVDDEDFEKEIQNKVLC